MYAKGKNHPPHNTCSRNVGEGNDGISPKKEAIYGWSKTE
jgi:hypothetical protein